MSPKRGDRAAPPPNGDEWDVRFSTNEAVKGWEELANAAPSNTRQAWTTMRSHPGPGPGRPTSRHHQLKGSLATGQHGGRELPLWQIEVTGCGRIWYLFDEDKRVVWIHYASVKHPKSTE